MFYLVRYKIRTVYINEGGHVKYIKLLASIFKGSRFFIHIRIIEDTKKQRIGSIPTNITLITISEYMKKELAIHGYCEALRVNDPYSFSESIKVDRKQNKELSISIIGRFTKNKGNKLVGEFFRSIDRLENSNFRVNIFGTVDDDQETKKIIQDLLHLNYIDVKVHGFVSNPSEIYSVTDVVIHFCLIEPLGRIYLEAINKLIPLIGFRSGGIQEIALNCNLSKYLVNNQDGWKENMLDKLRFIMKNWDEVEVDIVQAKKIAELKYSSYSYTKQLEKLFAQAD
jgi:glycosyltransferase involved in cell wall biosynthesis